jgi:voltage-gated potassium channel
MKTHFSFKKIFGTTIHLFSNIFHLVFDIPFIVLTLVGNLVVSSFAICFYLLEKEVNSKLFSMVDAFWWSFATATTTGYGDITPVTFWGKILGILLMLVGTALFSIYTAFFAKAILGEDFSIRPRKKNYQEESNS